MTEPAVETNGLDERRIVLAALDILAERGVDGLTMRLLADRLGVTVGAAYKHVASKHDLLRLVLLDLSERIVAADRPEADPLDRVRHLLLGYHEVMSSYAGLAAFMSTHLADLAPYRLGILTHQALVDAGFTGDGPERAMRVLFFYTGGALLTLPGASQLDHEVISSWYRDGLDITINGLRQELTARR
jgi:AcrR family transcriptional regulator